MGKNLKKNMYVCIYMAFAGGSDGKKSACNVEDPGSVPGSGRSPGEVFLPGESHGQRSLAGSSPWGRKESDTTERLTLSLFIWIYTHI